MKVYVTKYALSTGIFVADAEGTDSQGMIRVRAEKSLDAFFHTGEWHLTAEEALIKAEKMRVAKLISLDKQMKKLASMDFAGQVKP